MYIATRCFPPAATRRSITSQLYALQELFILRESLCVVSDFSSCRHPLICMASVLQYLWPGSSTTVLVFSDWCSCLVCMIMYVTWTYKEFLVQPHNACICVVLLHNMCTPYSVSQCGHHEMLLQWIFGHYLLHQCRQWPYSRIGISSAQYLCWSSTIHDTMSSL